LGAGSSPADSLPQEVIDGRLHFYRRILKRGEEVNGKLKVQ
jgi:hypothetical protein